MKTIIWKIRYMLAIRRLVGVSFRIGWNMAGGTVESLGDDLENCTPLEAAEAERDEWIVCSDKNL